MTPTKQVLGDRPIDQWKVTELKDELKRRKLKTNGLKDELVRRLSDAMEKEIESTEENAEEEPENAVDGKSEDRIETGMAASACEVQDVEACVEPDYSAKEEMLTVQDSNLEKDPMGAVVDAGIKEGDNSVPEIKENLVVQETNVETSLMGTTIETKSIIENEMMPDIAVSEVPCDEVKLDSSEPSNQVSVVSPTLGFTVKSNSVSCDIINSTNEKNDKKDNIIADDVKLELDVKLPERGQPSSDGGSPHPMDVIEKPEIKISMKSDPGDSMASEKLNLDRISLDESVEDDDVFESKQLDPVNSIAEATVDDVDKPEAPVMMAVDQETQAPVEEAIIKVPAPSAKRKLDQEGNSTVEGGKRQRRWNTNSDIHVEQRETTNLHESSTVIKRNTTVVNEGAPKERIVPPSSKPPTNSLRIDRFLRPFTLKAVQDLVGKTGKVTSFWMDHIKTHCYVTYSCVEEAIESRNAVYNLQWPQNGGRLLVAEFVDPQEVKSRVEHQIVHHPPAAVTPTSSRHHLPAAVTPTSSRHHRQVQQQPMIPHLPPPPPLAKPPVSAKMEHSLPLPPPPPPVVEKAPVRRTLDDIFRKTKATPRIYYLPLSDDQVAEKRRSQQKKN